MNFYKGEIGSILIVYSLIYVKKNVYEKILHRLLLVLRIAEKTILKTTMNLYDRFSFYWSCSSVLFCCCWFVVVVCLGFFFWSLGGWTFWSDWTTCPIPCEGRSKSRRRYCVTQFCNGEYYQVKSCEPRDCLGLFVFAFLKFNLICF